MGDVVLGHHAADQQLGDSTLREFLLEVVCSKLSANDFTTTGASGAAARMRSWISTPGVPALKNGEMPAAGSATCWMWITSTPASFARATAASMFASVASVFQRGNAPPPK